MLEKFTQFIDNIVINTYDIFNAKDINEFDEILESDSQYVAGGLAISTLNK